MYLIIHIIKYYDSLQYLLHVPTFHDTLSFYQYIRINHLINVTNLS